MRRLAVIAVATASLALIAAACGGEKDRTTEPSTVVGTIETGAAETGATETGATETGGAETTGATETSGAAQGDPVAGKDVFANAGCASCHTLADAGATGTVGPNLDDAKPAYDLVVDRVTNGKGAMPAFGTQNLLTAEQIQDVAAYVVQATSGG